MRYPKFLENGSKITLIAPSFGATTEPYITKVKAAIRKFKKLGYEVVIGENVNKAELPYISNEPKLVAKEFMDHYQKDTRLLLSVGGGELQCETLPYLDFELLKKSEPTWFCGFSDNTNYSFLLATLADTAAIYGVCAGAFGMYNWYTNIKQCYSLLTGTDLVVKGYDKFQGKWTAYQERHPLASYHLSKEKVLTCFPSDEENFSGRLLGGCLDILILLCGTKYDKVKEFNAKYHEDGTIWFLEACDLTALSYRRALFQLKEAGWFDTAKGFIIGRPLRAFNDETFGINRINALDILKDLNVPIIADCDLGHINPSMPIITGSYANVSVKNNNIEIAMELK